MRCTVAVVAAASFLCLPSGAASLSAASDSTTRSVTAHAEVASRTSLAVSNQLLQFTVVHPGDAAIATVEFVAGARTPAGAEVMLTVEAQQDLPGANVTFAGDGEGTLHGAMTLLHPSLAGRWVGSGRRSGRVSFALRATAPGTYTLPVRFVLTAP